MSDTGDAARDRTSETEREDRSGSRRTTSSCSTTTTTRYEYVIEMLKELFGHPVEKGFKLAEEVDTTRPGDRADDHAWSTPS